MLRSGLPQRRVAIIEKTPADASGFPVSDDEKAAIDAARRSGFASDDGVAAFWKRYGLG